MPESQDQELQEGKSAAFYRTRWLYAHNRLHAIANDGKAPLEQWSGYLEDLKRAHEAAALPA
jgi:hypothetical protein